MLYEIVKRVLDIVISIIALVVFSPLMLLVAILIKLEDGGTVFVPNPKRVGKNGDLFYMYKFRSMVPNAHERMQNGEYEEYMEQWKNNHGKLPIKVDPRITSVGKIIRKTDIDEIPQFINVLLGSMSVVGPRPLPQDQIDRNIKQYPEIKKYLTSALSAKPGITGIWQISGRNSIPTPKQYKMNAEYGDRRSVLYDISIMLKTPIAVIRRDGVYE